MADFLPKNTEIPASSGKYMRVQDPENKFRVLGSAVIGYELWVEGKPKRAHTAEDFTSRDLVNADINKFTGEQKKPQYFWAFPVFNYKTEQIEILELTQISIMQGIKDYLDDEDYGDPKGYDLIVVREEQNDKVKYRVKAKPPKAIDGGIKQAYKDLNINLNELYSGGDPFNSESEPEVDINDIPDELAQ